MRFNEMTIETPAAIMSERSINVASYLLLESWIERCLSESESKRYSSHTSLGNISNDERKQRKHTQTLQQQAFLCPRSTLRGHA